MKKGKPKSEEHKRKLSKANKGKPKSEATKQKMSEARRGKPRSEATKRKISEAQKGKTVSEVAKRKMSKSKKGKTRKPFTEETKRKMSEAQKGKPSPLKATKRTEETKQKMSAAQQGIPYNEWEAYACEKKYCPKFDEKCRESNRNKYGRRCFICNKTEKANGQKLSVHHVDMDKAQGCESNWQLVPLCKHCHGSAHNDELIARLGYILRVK